MSTTSNNPHDISRAINLELLDPKFAAALQQAWGREACWPGCVNDYPENRADNPSLGNCLVSVLAAYASRGMRDELIPSKVDEFAWHFRLGLKEPQGIVPVDPTWQQFAEGAVFRALTPGTDEYAEVMKGSLLDDKVSGDATLVPRLAVIIDRMKSLGGFDLGYTAEQIVENVRTHYALVLEASNSAVKLSIQNNLSSPSPKL